MNKKEALEIIKQYNLNPPKPIIKYYQDPYADGYGDASGYYAEMPPIDPLVIDAILERDKDCKEYMPDSESYADEKFNQEMERRFTDLMSRAGDTAVDEYRKNNSQLYSMVTENHYNKITVIPMSLSTLCDFKEKCEKAAGEIGLKNFYIHEHEDDNDLNCKMVYGSSSYSGLFMTNSSKAAFSDAIRYCEYFKRHAKESLNYETIESLCDNIKEQIKDLCEMIESDYMQRINNYIDKERFSGKNYE